MSDPDTARVHLVAGGFPPGSHAAHDMDYARLRLLGLLQESPGVHATVASDFSAIERWLPGCALLLTYTAGPFLAEDQAEAVTRWLEDGGHWLGLHGTSGGKAARVEGNPRARKMVRTAHHDVLGGFFLNHPPVRRFRVDVAKSEHPLVRGLPASFEVNDELYFIELRDPSHTQVLLTTELPKDPAPGFGFAYDEDTSLLEDGKTRAIGYARDVGRGGVAYVALGHCHSPSTNGQPFVDTSVDADGTTPLSFRGAWETDAFDRILRNGIAWGIGRASQLSPPI